MHQYGLWKSEYTVEIGNKVGSTRWNKAELGHTGPGKKLGVHSSNPCKWEAFL